MVKDDKRGGRKEREIESERGLRNGGWWRHREEMMNTKGKNEPRNNQTFIKQLSFLSYKFTFYRSGESGSYVRRYVAPVLSTWVERLNQIGTLLRSLGEA